MPDESAGPDQQATLWTDSPTVAKRLGIGLQSLYKMAREGRISGCFRVDERRWRWHLPTVELWVAERASQSHRQRMKVTVEHPRRGRTTG